MQTLYEQYFAIPMPFLWLMLAGLVLWRSRVASRALFAVGTIVFLIVCLPATGKLLTRGLADGAVPPESIMGGGLAAVVVPTGGSFDDITGRWWPATASVTRVVAARRLALRLGVPLLIVGGSPLAGQPPESLIVARALGLTEPDVILGTTARDSAESGAEVAQLLSSQPLRRVVMVTSAVHIARMSAALRRNGLDVIAVLSRKKKQKMALSIGDFLPSRGGLGLTGGAVREYVGIMWYLATGRIAIADLGN